MGVGMEIGMEAVVEVVMEEEVVMEVEGVMEVEVVDLAILAPNYNSYKKKTDIKFHGKMNKKPKQVDIFYSSENVLSSPILFILIFFSYYICTNVNNFTHDI